MLFRVELAREGESILGYSWIEVLAIQPRALVSSDKPSFGLGEWASYQIVSVLICRTDYGIVKIAEDDLWPEIEAGVYAEVGGE